MPPRDGLPGTGLGRRLSDAGQDYSEEALREQLDPYPAIASQTTMGPNQPNPAGEPFHMELGEDRFTYPPDKNAQKLLDDYSSLFKTNRFRPREWPGDIPKQPVYVPNPNPYVIPDEEARMKVMEDMAAILSDAEVEAYFKEKKAARKTGEFGAPNYETIMKEMGDHLKALRTSGSPTGSAGSNSSSVSVASDKSITPEQVQKLVRKLGMKYTIYKPEMVQIINLRPTDLNVLSSIIEDIDHRMMDVSQQDVLDIIRECLELGPKEESEDKETEEEQEEEEDVEEA